MAGLPTLESLPIEHLSRLLGRPENTCLFDAGPPGERWKAGRDWRRSPTLLLFEHMPIGLAIYDHRGLLAHANAYFDRLVTSSRFPSHRIPDNALWAAWSSDGHELAPADFPCERALRGEIVSPGVEMRHSGQDGRERWLTVSASPIVDPARNRPLGVVLLYVDAGRTAPPIDARRLFGDFAEASGSAVWNADVAGGRFAYGNALHLSLRGDAARPGLADWLESVVEADRDRLARCHETARAGGIGRSDYSIATPAGLRRLHETCFAVRDEAGRVTMIAGIAEDVTPAVQQPVYHIGDLPPCDGRPLGGAVKRFADIAALLDMADFLSPGCVVIDIATCPDADADLARALASLPPTLPAIVVGRPDTHAATAIAAMRAGAVDYLIPPVPGDGLAAALAGAAARIPLSPPADLPAAPPPDDTADRLRRLSKREREVLVGLVAGGTNKSIARDLGISPRTVELHRAGLMERMNVPNLAMLLRVARQCGIH